MIPDGVMGAGGRTRRRPPRTLANLAADPAFWVGAAIVGATVAVAVLAPLIAPHDPDHAFRLREGGLTARGDPVGPGPDFLLGTDRLGRDELSRLIHGARTSLTVGLLANLMATVIGLVVGAVAAYAGSPRIGIGPRRWRRSMRLPIETVLMRLTDITLALPALLLAMALSAVVGASLWLVTAVIAGVLWTGTARVVYGRVLDVRRNDFVLGAEAIGVSPFRIFARHLLPHVMPVVVVYASLGISATVLFEATLSFLGAGVPPPTASWGSMVSEHVSYYASQPRLVLLPGASIALTVLGFNLLGDALRDALDPTHPGAVERPVKPVAHVAGAHSEGI